MRSLHRALICLAMVFLAITGGSSTLWAQFTSSMEGTVIDPSGARVPGAVVTVLNVATGVKSATQSNSVGYFQLPSLPPGTFRVTDTSKAPSWNFGIQQVLTPTISIEVNYVGNAGRHLYSKYNMNRYAG